jgi:hypothetical protein
MMNLISLSSECWRFRLSIFRPRVSYLFNELRKIAIEINTVPVLSATRLTQLIIAWNMKIEQGRSLKVRQRYF